MKEGIHHRILMALVGVGLIYIIQEAWSSLVYILVYINDKVGASPEGSRLFAYALVFATVILIFGFVLSISLYKQMEWARKGIVLIAVILLALSMNLMLDFLITDFSHLKRVSGATDPMVILGYRLLRYAGFAIWSTATIYFATAYPKKESEPEFASSPGSPPKAI